MPTCTFCSRSRLKTFPISMQHLDPGQRPFVAAPGIKQQLDGIRWIVPGIFQ